jgi:hypothetical protein
MTGAPASEPAGARAEYPERWLHEAWVQLTARGFIIDEPTHRTCQCFFGSLRSAQCEMDLLVTGALVWEYLPLGGTSPDQAARLALALLGGIGPARCGLPPARYPGLALKEAAGRILASCGMAVRLVDVRYDDVRAEAMVTNPGEPARGHVRISDEGTIRWECLFASPSSPVGLAPLDIARAIATALAEYRIAGVRRSRRHRPRPGGGAAAGGMVNVARPGTRSGERA